MQYKQVDGNRQLLPKAWTFKDGSQTGNFDLLPESVHNAEGWYQCLDDPVVETPATHKLGVDTLVVNKWNRVVVPMPDEEQDDYAAEQLAIAAAEQLAIDITAARERLADLIAEFPALVYYVGKTDIELDNAVNTALSAAVIQDPALLYVALRQVNKQQSKAIRDIGDIMAGMIKEDLRNGI